MSLDSNVYSDGIDNHYNLFINQLHKPITTITFYS